MLRCLGLHGMVFSTHERVLAMIDPVCGTNVDADTESVTGPDGVEYGFCCASCRWAFEKNPYAFVRKRRPTP